MNQLSKYIDFHFALAVVAIFGVAGFLSLQFSQANTEFDTLNASMYSVVRSQGSDLNDDVYIDHQLDQLQKNIEALEL